MKDGLRPLQLRPFVLGAVITHANQALAPPMLDVLDPGLEGLGRFFDRVAAVTALAGCGLVGAGNLLTLRRKLCILREKRSGEGEEKKRST